MVILGYILLHIVRHNYSGLHMIILGCIFCFTYGYIGLHMVTAGYIMLQWLHMVTVGYIYLQRVTHCYSGLHIGTLGYR